jgi:4-carboxymuconolactone decarboxylase
VATLTPGADYEWGQHVAIARQTGVREDEIAALERGDLDAFDADERLVLDFTDQVVRDATPDDRTLAAFLARFSAAELIHLILVIGQYMMIGRVMATTGLAPEDAIGLEALRPS